MTKEVLSDLDKSRLSAEEIAAFEEDDGDDHTTKPEGEDDEGADKATATDKPEAKAEEAKVEDKPEPVVDDKDPPIKFEVAAPADDPDTEKKLAEIEKKYEDGELTLKEYNRERDAITEASITARVTPKVLEEINLQVEEKTWKRAQSDFFDEKPVYKSDPLLYDALNGEIKRVAGEKNEDGTLKHENRSDAWVLREAHRRVAERFKLEDKPKAKDPVAEAREKRKPDLSVVPKTLTGVTVAADPVDGGEFDHLDKITDSGDLERAIAKMTPEQQDRWARQA